MLASCYISALVKYYINAKAAKDNKVLTYS